jgi:hypothetical protein
MFIVQLIFLGIKEGKGLLIFRHSSRVQGICMDMHLSQHILICSNF